METKVFRLYSFQIVMIPCITIPYMKTVLITRGRENRRVLPFAFLFIYCVWGKYKYGEEAKMWRTKIRNSLIGASGAVKEFPVSILSAFGFMLVTLVRIYMDWPAQEAYNFLFGCLHLAFAFGAILGLMLITLDRRLHDDQRWFLHANIVTGIVVGILIWILYNFGGIARTGSDASILYLSELARNRMIVLMSISGIWFVYGLKRKDQQAMFGPPLFMVQKAYVVAVFYGLIVMLGTAMVAGAVQALLFEEMSEKVYMVLGTLSGFFAFLVFVGYFRPNKDENQEYLRAVESQPTFIRRLFELILIPIMMAMTVVLLMWAFKIIFTGEWPRFAELSGIILSYVLIGIWLHFMVTEHSAVSSKFYKKVFPICSLVILSFGIWGWLRHLNESGLKTDSYVFILIWIVGIIASVVLPIKKERSHTVIATVISIVLLVSVLPIVGSHRLPVRSQLDRLETLLMSANMFDKGQIIPASEEVSSEAKEDITNAVLYITREEAPKLPEWFDPQLEEHAYFESTMGFEWTWPKMDYDSQDRRYGLNLQLSQGIVEIKGYDYAVSLNPRGYMSEERGAIDLTGHNDTYTIEWLVDRYSGIPTLKIIAGEKVILKENLQGYLQTLTDKFPPGEEKQRMETIEDMSLTIENEQLKVLLVFRFIDINVDVEEDRINYYLDVDKLYIKEND